MNIQDQIDEISVSLLDAQMHERKAAELRQHAKKIAEKVFNATMLTSDGAATVVVSEGMAEVHQHQTAEEWAERNAP